MEMIMGVVEDNLDPYKRNRVKVRLYGIDTDTDNGEPQIPTDDLYWCVPFTAGSIPPLGSTVIVLRQGDFMCYSYTDLSSRVAADDNYMNTVTLIDKSNLSQEIEDGKVINTSASDSIKVQYNEVDGFTIELSTVMGTNIISVTPTNDISILNANGDGFDLSMADSKLTLKADNIALSCKTLEINTSTGSTGESKGILLTDFLNKYNNHTHNCPDGLTSIPNVEADLVSADHITLIE